MRDARLFVFIASGSFAIIRAGNQRRIGQFDRLHLAVQTIHHRSGAKDILACAAFTSSSADQQDFFRRGLPQLRDQGPQIQEGTDQNARRPFARHQGAGAIGGGSDNGPACDRLPGEFTRRVAQIEVRPAAERRRDLQAVPLAGKQPIRIPLPQRHGLADLADRSDGGRPIGQGLGHHARRAEHVEHDAGRRAQIPLRQHRLFHRRQQHFDSHAARIVPAAAVRRNVAELPGSRSGFLVA